MNILNPMTVTWTPCGIELGFSESIPSRRLEAEISQIKISVVIL